MSLLTRWLRISPVADDRLGDTVEHLQTATEFTEKVAEAVEDGKAETVLEAVLQAAPWLESGWLDAIGGEIPVIKVVLAALKYITEETEAQVLGLLAFSLAFESAAAKTMAAMEKDPDLAHQITTRNRIGLRIAVGGTHKDPEVFHDFRLDRCFDHSLMRDADTRLQSLVKAVGWPEKAQRLLLEGVHTRFRPEFRRIISDRRTQEKFAPLLAFLGLNGDSGGFAAVDRHIDYQLWCFNQTPMLGKRESSALPRDMPVTLRGSLRDMYVQPDCGLLNWGEIQQLKGAGPDGPGQTPLDEHAGGRRPLSREVVRFIGDAAFQDAIVVQGIAGSGKSAFTLYLCSELRSLGLRPIRIRMRHLPIESQMSLEEEIGHALSQNSGDDDFDELMGSPRPAPEDFTFSHLFGESVRFRGAEICPHVLIFDGWDEISVSAGEGFRQQIESLLRRIRNETVNRRDLRVRVILTGRPSLDVEETHFLRARTPVFTIRPLSLDNLEQLASSLIEEASTASSACVASLRGKFDELRNRLAMPPTELDPEGLGILGLPLLALLAIWLTLGDEARPEEVGTELTMLYRRLVDITCKYGGRLEEVPGAPGDVGSELRQRLHCVAAAITIRGSENISFVELQERLQREGLSTDDRVGRVMRDSPIISLMLAFFFVANTREQGCEFVHKSFREYLFAEALIEELKKASASPLGGARPASGTGRMPPRAQYWADFADADPRSRIADRLAALVSAQWLTPEVVRHTSALLDWEVERSVALQGNPGEVQHHELQPLPFEAWCQMRDCLADLWDWWADGVHLRQQPYKSRRLPGFEYAMPRVIDLGSALAPVDLPRDKLPEPLRMVTLDAHLGDALFRLNCTLHFHIKEKAGWLRDDAGGEARAAEKLWAGTRHDPERRYQTRIDRSGQAWISFSPSTPDGAIHYLFWLASRINAAGWRPEGPFPSGVDMRGIDLSGCSMEQARFGRVRLSYANLEEARLCGTDFSEDTSRLRTLFPFLRFGGTDLFCANLARVDLRHANLSGIQLSRANLRNADLSHADLSGGDLTGATLSQAVLHRTNLNRTNLSETSCEGVSSIVQAQLDEAYYAGGEPRLPSDLNPPPAVIARQ